LSGQAGNGSEIEAPDHAESPQEPAPGPSQASDERHEQAGHADEERQREENGDAHWSAPAKPRLSGGVPEAIRATHADDAAPEASQGRQHEPAHVEQPAEEDDPSRPARKGWWQRRFTGS
jgi:hypothetical protein